MLTNTDNLKSWLEDLLKERINKDIYIIKIKVHGDKYYWQIRFKNSDSFIQIPIIKKLYQLMMVVYHLVIKVKMELFWHQLIITVENIVIFLHYTLKFIL